MRPRIPFAAMAASSTLTAVGVLLLLVAVETAG